MQEAQIQQEISTQDCKCLSSLRVLGPTAMTSFFSRDARQNSVWFQIEKPPQLKNLSIYPCQKKTIADSLQTVWPGVVFSPQKFLSKLRDSSRHAVGGVCGGVGGDWGSWFPKLTAEVMEPIWVLSQWTHEIFHGSPPPWLCFFTAGAASINS